jgi:uncharacterized protein (DUF433 family)
MLGILGQGIYSCREVAQLIGMPARRVRTWVCGEGTTHRAIVESDYQEIRDGGCVMSFLDLIDSFVISRFRQHGISLQYLRKVYGALVEEFQTPHPMSRRDLLTDGKKIFISIADEMGEEKLREVLPRQYVFKTILRPHLRLIDYDPSSMLAVRWRIMPGVVLDPSRQYGKPVIDAAGMPAYVLYAAYRANGRDSKAVAEWYGVTEGDVALAVKFHKRLGRTAA